MARTTKAKQKQGIDNLASSLFEGLIVQPDALPDYPVIRTGIKVLDEHIFTAGGLRAGTMTEIHGEDSAGKSFFLAWMLAQAQAQYPDRVIALIDSENSFNPELAMMLGFNPKHPNFFYKRSASVEDTFVIISEVMKLNPIFIGWDSVGNSDSSKRLDDPTYAKRSKGVVKAETPGLHAAALTPGMKKWAQLLGDKEPEDAPACLIVNQLRDSIGVMFGPKTHTPGGRAFRHNMHMRIEISKKGDMLDSEDEPTGLEAAFRVKRSKLGVAGRLDGERYPYARFPLAGITAVPIMDKVDEAVELEFVTGTSKLKWRDLDDELHKHASKENMYADFLDDPDYYVLFCRAFKAYKKELNGTVPQDQEDQDVQKIDKMLAATETEAQEDRPRRRRIASE